MASPKGTSKSPTQTLRPEGKDFTAEAIIDGKYKILEELGGGGMGIA